jgi:hypothetical protein
MLKMEGHMHIYIILKLLIPCNVHDIIKLQLKDNEDDDDADDDF